MIHPSTHYVPAERMDSLMRETNRQKQNTHIHRPFVSFQMSIRIVREQLSGQVYPKAPASFTDRPDTHRSMDVDLAVRRFGDERPVGYR